MYPVGPSGGASAEVRAQLCGGSGTRMRNPSPTLGQPERPQLLPSIPRRVNSAGASGSDKPATGGAEGSSTSCPGSLDQIFPGAESRQGIELPVSVATGGVIPAAGPPSPELMEIYPRADELDEEVGRRGPGSAAPAGYRGRTLVGEDPREWDAETGFPWESVQDLGRPRSGRRVAAIGTHRPVGGSSSGTT